MWIAELFMWAVLLFSALFISMYAFNANVRKHNTYYVFFQDVDGLIKGSPVKFHGYQVGYVSNLSVVNEEVFLTFIITDKDFKMPKQIVASIEWSGLGASKSLELEAAGEAAKGKNIISVVEPRRIKDFYDNTNEIADNIIFMTTDFIRIFNDKTVREMKTFIQFPTLLRDAEAILETLNSNYDKLNGKMNDKKLEKREKNGKKLQ